MYIYIHRINLQNLNMRLNVFKNAIRLKFVKLNYLLHKIIMNLVYLKM